MIFSPATFIEKKRDKKEHDPEEIQKFIRGLGDGTVKDYQASAWLMAVFLNGLSLNETIALTHAMANSGSRYNLDEIEGYKADKHSTGGVGDKVSIILAPLAAACGLVVPMMTGRGLGHTGGTSDKLQSIHGYRIQLPDETYKDILKRVGCSVIGQSEAIAPADRKLYSLRDVCGTTNSIPLVVSSVLSKKICEGADTMVFDVKWGSGAFVTTKAGGRKMANWLKKVGNGAGLNCQSVISDMNQPLGYAAGNLIEIQECVEVLRGMNPGFERARSKDLVNLTLHLCAVMLQTSGMEKNFKKALKVAKTKLNDGSAFEKFLAMVELHGGNPSQIEDPQKIRLAPVERTFNARRNGTLNAINTFWIGKLVIELGGGRKSASDEIDMEVGLVFEKKLGSKVKAGEPIVRVFARSEDALDELEERFHKEIKIGTAPKKAPDLLLESGVS